MSVALRHALAECARCAELEEQVAFLRSELGLSDDEVLEARLQGAFGLTPQGAKLLALLHRRGERPTSWTLVDEALPKPTGERSAPRPFVNVLVSGLRRALGPESVENIHGVGWRLTAGARPIVARAAENAIPLGWRGRPL